MASRFPARWRLAAALLACAPLGACTEQIQPLSASFETLQLLRENAVPPMALGSFTSASKEVGKTVTIRLSAMKPPKGGNFAEFLGATFETELQAAGKLDPASPLRIGAVLTESHVGEDMAKGRASLGATVALTRAGVEIFTRPYRVETRWQSDFIGALAIPEAFRQYNSLYALLVRKAMSDPELLAAAKG
jgi:hypothetical protein